MVRLGKIFAENLKKNRLKCGFTQTQLAEKADVSTHHIGMIEVCRNYPTIELVERLALALGIESYQLFLESSFAESHYKNEEFDMLRHDIKNDMKQLLSEFIEEAEAKHCKDKASV